jgi:hypothetical protein
MYLIRDLFSAKPGKAGELVKKFKRAAPLMDEEGKYKYRIMTDISGPYWTVIMETEMPDLNEFVKETRGGGKPMPEVEEIMKDYHELVTGGKREIYLIED